jgi:hypothetical protein
MWNQTCRRQARVLLSGAAMALLLCMAAGCGGRTMKITTADYINTAFVPKGAPLEVDIVTVLPGDFKNEKEEANQDLLPDAMITSNVWFERRPTALSLNKVGDTYHFKIPRSRIICFTDDEDAYGERRGGAILGANYREDPEIIVKDLPTTSNPLNWFSKRYMVYVFCKFQDAEGKDVLPTRPAVFAPVYRHGGKLAVHVNETSIEVADKSTSSSRSASKEKKPEAPAASK